LEYTRIAWGALLGYAIWHEVPGIWTWMGAALIVGSGVYTTLGHKPVAGTVS
jgi:drug/metabolite transporter (DMT)-like permease